MAAGRDPVAGASRDIVLGICSDLVGLDPDHREQSWTSGEVDYAWNIVCTLHG
jgi:hypothetical protein